MLTFVTGFIAGAAAVIAGAWYAQSERRKTIKRLKRIGQVRKPDERVVCWHAAILQDTDGHIAWIDTTEDPTILHTSEA